MEKSFLEFFKKFSQLNLSDILEIYKISSIKSYKAGEKIAQEGDQFDFALGILKGVIRTYVIKSNGEERTVRIALEKDFTACANCLLNDGKSNEFLEAVEDCLVIQINTRKFKELTQQNIRLLRFWSDNIGQVLNETTNRILFFVVMTPEERYQALLDQNPEIILRVPQKYLASYIGITTVSLSRIRSRKANSNN
ncbi:Crp/Fnr family transcriptional regulator [Algoriphagus limi]|uniref:Crp/Fnr family transcriptional regulator n=1 Tax=Algoriphagus limi TaxID=2975273 RepID=A0ABT2G2K3_9BACT|nr:Crp/Fnr family transcriptional regulator [Algoriphagus limi]MCS5489480.1 Crp/Fnr family transcriptional regulator [Algoriphagus limi]